MYSLYDLGLFLLIYSFLGWAVEAAYYTVTRRKLCNRGILSLPLMLCYGFTFDLLILVLPTLAGRHILSFLASMVAVSVVESLSDHFLHRVGPKIQWQAERSHLLSGTGKVLTWVVVFVMVCNAVLTSAAMLRYNIRAVHPEPTNAFSAFLDRQYPDSFMETRWPNMIVTDGESSLP